MGRWKKLVAESSGAEIAEAAFVLPVVFFFVFGIIWFGRAFNIYSTINSAAHEGARTAARPTCATCDATGTWNGTGLPGDQAVEDAVVSVLQASRVDKTRISAYVPAHTFCAVPPPAPPGTCTASVNNITVCRFVRLNPPGTPEQCGTLVSFQYPFQFLLEYTPSALAQRQVILSAEAEARMQN